MSATIQWQARCFAMSADGGIVASLPNGTHVSFTFSRKGYYQIWRAEHLGKTVGGHESRPEWREATGAWLQRVADEASKRGPSTARELGWY